ncbi:hypothetical protein HJC23_005097 [Cyclotella cryptica]|uniref:Uncharacterized protein n=1 Tax=Cyclotella cryptica TaxID=29204 RepID=A0ABD3QGD1_9STRA|eukprot:CCRYP_005785-RA/>CCRYP_005785-RA protein AED:0.17 eAED:0.17 QI:0/-1/0/1/-1/1/1/0/300
MSTKFDSEGFDLSASTTNTDGNVIYEIGGGVTPNSPPPNDGPTSESERLKERGNDHFRRGNHLDAYDDYTEAIVACPCGEGIGPDGGTLLKLKREFEEEQRERNAAKHRAEMERRRSGRRDDDDADDGGDGPKKQPAKEEDEKTKEPNKKEDDQFVPPRHLYGHKLAVYYANRAATLLHMDRLEEAIDDCDVALLFNPLYVKAYMRRSTANERNENTEEALRDARKAVELDPANATARKNMMRLEKIEAERLEKLKEETMGKLKELGNSILGNFGLSLDNFQAVQDPKTGGYSISFNQNK